ncbi:MAG: hypothetical protein SV186_02615 [Candidatus Nanohaloarchaea archaeon]|nr:hypothetical protein [Candidatus Nanohaloarchaea archaeon]
MDLSLNKQAVIDFKQASLGWLAGIIGIAIMGQFTDQQIFNLTFLTGFTAFYFLASMVIWYLAGGDAE